MADDRERNEAGRYVPVVTREAVLAVFNEVRGPAITSRDVAESLGCTTEAARQRLAQLHDDGEVERRKTGRTVLWWRSSDEDERLDEEPVSGPEADDTEDTRTPDEGHTSARASMSTNAEEGLAGVDFPQTKDRAECEAAVYAARDYLREHGPASMRKIVSAVMPAHPLGYDVPDLEPGDRFRGAWWRRIVKPGLEAHPDVEPPAPGASEWRYVASDPDERDRRL